MEADDSLHPQASVDLDELMDVGHKNAHQQAKMLFHARRLSSISNSTGEKLRGPARVMRRPSTLGHTLPTAVSRPQGRRSSSIAVTVPQTTNGPGDSTRATGGVRVQPRASVISVTPAADVDHTPSPSTSNSSHAPRGEKLVSLDKELVSEWTQSIRQRMEDSRSDHTQSQPRLPTTAPQQRSMLHSQSASTLKKKERGRGLPRARTPGYARPRTSAPRTRSRRSTRGPTPEKEQVNGDPVPYISPASFMAHLRGGMDKIRRQIAKSEGVRLGGSREHEEVHAFSQSMRRRGAKPRPATSGAQPHGMEDNSPQEQGTLEAGAGTGPEAEDVTLIKKGTNALEDSLVPVQRHRPARMYGQIVEHTHKHDEEEDEEHRTGGGNSGPLLSVNKRYVFFRTPNVSDSIAESEQSGVVPRTLIPPEDHCRDYSQVSMNGMEDLLRRKREQRNRDAGREVEQVVHEVPTHLIVFPSPQPVQRKETELLSQWMTGRLAHVAHIESRAQLFKSVLEGEDTNTQAAQELIRVSSTSLPEGIVDAIHKGGEAVLISKYHFWVLFTALFELGRQSLTSLKDIGVLIMKVCSELQKYVRGLWRAIPPPKPPRKRVVEATQAPVDDALKRYRQAARQTRTVKVLELELRDMADVVEAERESYQVDRKGLQTRISSLEAELAAMKQSAELSRVFDALNVNAEVVEPRRAPSATSKAVCVSVDTQTDTEALDQSDQQKGPEEAGVQEQEREQEQEQTVVPALFQELRRQPLQKENEELFTTLRALERQVAEHGGAEADFRVLMREKKDMQHRITKLRKLLERKKAVLGNLVNHAVKEENRHLKRKLRETSMAYKQLALAQAEMQQQQNTDIEQLKQEVQTLRRQAQRSPFQQLAHTALSQRKPGSGRRSIVSVERPEDTGPSQSPASASGGLPRRIHRRSHSLMVHMSGAKQTAGPDSTPQHDHPELDEEEEEVVDKKPPALLRRLSSLSMSSPTARSVTPPVPAFFGQGTKDKAHRKPRTTTPSVAAAKAATAVTPANLGMPPAVKNTAYQEDGDEEEEEEDEEEEAQHVQEEAHDANRAQQLDDQQLDVAEVEQVLRSVETAIDEEGALFNKQASGKNVPTLLVLELDRRYFEARIREARLMFQLLSLVGMEKASALSEEIARELVTHLKARNYTLARQVVWARGQLLLKMKDLSSEMVETNELMNLQCDVVSALNALNHMNALQRTGLKHAFSWLAEVQQQARKSHERHVVPHHRPSQYLRPDGPERNQPYAQSLLGDTMSIYAGGFSNLFLTQPEIFAHHVRAESWLTNLIADLVKKTLRADSISDVAGVARLDLCTIALQHFMGIHQVRHLAEIYVMEMLAGVHAYHSRNVRVKMFGRFCGLAGTPRYSRSFLSMYLHVLRSTSSVLKVGGIVPESEDEVSAEDSLFPMARIPRRVALDLVERAVVEVGQLSHVRRMRAKVDNQVVWSSSLDTSAGSPDGQGRQLRGSNSSKASLLVEQGDCSLDELLEATVDAYKSIVFDQVMALFQALPPFIAPTAPSADPLLGGEEVRGANQVNPEVTMSLFSDRVRAVQRSPTPNASVVCTCYFDCMRDMVKHSEVNSDPDSMPQVGADADSRGGQTSRTFLRFYELVSPIFEWDFVHTAATRDRALQKKAGRPRSRRRRSAEEAGSHDNEEEEEEEEEEDDDDDDYSDSESYGSSSSSDTRSIRSGRSDAASLEPHDRPAEPEQRYVSSADAFAAAAHDLLKERSGTGTGGQAAAHDNSWSTDSDVVENDIEQMFDNKQ